MRFYKCPLDFGTNRVEAILLDGSLPLSIASPLKTSLPKYGLIAANWNS